MRVFLLFRVKIKWNNEFMGMNYGRRTYFLFIVSIAFSFIVDAWNI